jgi:polyhydroxybutyrate depolymerase
MKKILSLCSLIICCIVILPIASSSYSEIENPSQLLDIEPGDYTYHILHDGQLRDYRVHVPPSLSSDKPPVVIVMHGGLGNSIIMEKMTSFSEKADMEGFLVVYPNGTSIRGRPESRVWNSGHCCGIALEQNVDDVGFIREVIEALKINYSINPSRVYITGFSNGAMMTYRLGAELSDIVAAIAPVSGTIGGHATEDAPLYIIPDPLYPVPVLAMHGKLDEQVKYDGGHGNETIGTRIDLSVNESISFWVRNNGCSQTPVTIVDGNITIDTYSKCKLKAKVILYTIQNGEHAWPGGLGDTAQEVNATDVIWDFFKDISKNLKKPNQGLNDPPRIIGRRGVDPVNIKTDLKPLSDRLLLELMSRSNNLFNEPLNNCGCS